MRSKLDTYTILSNQLLCSVLSGNLPIILKQKKSLELLKEDTRFVLVPYHRIQEETGFDKEFYSLLDAIRDMSPYALKDCPKVSLSYEWDNSFEEELYNARRTIQNIKINNHRSDPPTVCNNVLCRALASKKQYQDQKITGDCINTNNKEVIMDLEEVLVRQLGYEKNHIIAKRFKKLLQSNVKTRLMKKIDSNYMKEVIGEVSSFILSTCQDYCEKMDKMFGEDIFPEIFNTKELTKILMKFKKKILKKQAIYRKKKKRYPMERDLKSMQKFLKILQKFITFLKHDKKKGETQIICNHAAEKVAIMSADQQKRFTIQNNGKQQQEEAKQKIQRMIEDNIMKAETKDPTLQKLSIFQQLAKIFYIDIDKALEEHKPNENTANYKSHKEDKIFRVIIGCVNRDNHVNIIRQYHDIINGILHFVQEEYKDWSKQQYEDTGICHYNIIESTDTLVKIVNSFGEVQGQLETVDLEKCYPNHDIKVSEDRNTLDNPIKPYDLNQEIEDQNKGTLHQFWETNNTRTIFVNKYSTLHLLKQIIQITFKHGRNKLGSTIACITNKSRNPTDWQFTSSVEQMDQRNTIALTAKHFFFFFNTLQTSS